MAEAVGYVEGNMYVIVMVRGHTGPRCRRTHGRTYALCRDLGGLHLALWSSRDVSGRRKTPKSKMHEMEKSDRAIVAEKSANKEPSAELMERRALPKGNSQNPTTHHAQKWGCVHQGIERIREFVQRNPKFTTLLHHINEGSLKVAYHALKRDASPGVDHVTWEAYGADLERNIADLCPRVHRGSFRATPSRRVEIPKPDGGTRPLGIAALEDKIVQTAMVQCILEPIYENEFCGFSYGFRPGRSAHNALDALAYVIERRRVNYVVDADIRKFFDMVDQQWLLRFLEHRIADQRVLRLITKFLKAGVMEDGTWQESKRGTPQGAVISPILANIYLHYVLDLWFRFQRKSRKIGGESYIVRYADDFVESTKRMQSDFYTSCGHVWRNSDCAFILTKRGSSSLVVLRKETVGTAARGAPRPLTFWDLHTIAVRPKVGGLDWVASQSRSVCGAS